jgi:hypothetical protein
MNKAEFGALCCEEEACQSKTTRYVLGLEDHQTYTDSNNYAGR